MAINNQPGTTKVDIDLLKEIVEADYMDNDLIIIDGLKEIPAGQGSLQIDMMIVIMCLKGRMQLDINDTTFKAGASDLIVCPPNVYVGNYMMSPDFDAKIVCLSYRALQHLLHVNKQMWNMILYLSKNPVFHIDTYKRELLEQYHSLALMKHEHPEVPFYKESMECLFLAMFHELCSVIYETMPDESSPESLTMKQGDVLMRRFVRLVADSHGKERSVAFFADKLCITPKYLSTVCKASSGKTALEWIHEYAMEVIVQRLKYSEQTIKEIADDLQFPNISFFGKFVKSHLGVSPSAFRRQLSRQA